MMAMSKREHSNAEAVAPAIAREETFRSIWRKYRSEPCSGHSEMPLIRRALRNATARLKYRHVRRIRYRQLSLAGYDVRKFDDISAPPESERIAPLNLPEHWKIPQRVFVPEIAKLPNAVVFGNGATFLPDKRLFVGHKGMPKKFGSRLNAFVYHSDHPEECSLMRRHLRCMDLPGRHFKACYNSFWNFGHFVHDMLSLIYYEDLGAIVPGRDKLISPPMPWPMQQILFQKIFEGYEIVQVPLHVPIRVEELLFPAKLSHFSDGCNPAAIRSLARRMRRIVAPYSGRDRRKVCVSRRDARPFHAEEVAWRKFANVDAYETMMREMGYDVVEVSALDPDSQFALWANTTDIVGIHGAGMMNMIMMPFGGNYTEIAATTDLSCTVRCAMAAGHRVRVLENGARDAQGLLEIDLGQLEALLLNA